MLAGDCDVMVMEILTHMGPTHAYQMVKLLLSQNSFTGGFSLQGLFLPDLF